MPCASTADPHVNCNVTLLLQQSLRLHTALACRQDSVALPCLEQSCAGLPEGVELRDTLS
jgi:hypothetical protein